MYNYLEQLLRVQYKLILKMLFLHVFTKILSKVKKVKRELNS